MESRDTVRTQAVRLWIVPWDFLSETKLTCDVFIREQTWDQHLWEGAGGSRMCRGKASL